MDVLRGHLEHSLTDPGPRIDVFPARKSLRSRASLVIFPGGGYAGLADYEGEGYARHFSAHGIACFVVEYRLGAQGFRHPAMLEDALAAIGTIRERAAELGLAADRIGVMGSSAGGHLAALSLVGHGRYESSTSLRPDFGVLCYPVISMRDEFGHRGSRDSLIGESPSPQAIDEVSCELHVTPATPPCFLWHTREDDVVSFQNSMLFAAALHRSGVPFEIPVFDKGAHGLGQDLAHPWTLTCLHWLESR